MLFNSERAANKPVDKGTKRSFYHDQTNSIIMISTLKYSALQKRRVAAYRYLSTRKPKSMMEKLHHILDITLDRLY
ncbi:hypothetical protein DUE52_11635 [Larkinella punicea]|uniref:Uncharacterized protein n=1 Tax=Larkinella punicea TaxID=2315727 RepID=A0A368JQ99_9BACT|nr:hypothetical protein DUE52_11635 [Larkinella punicea]